MNLINSNMKNISYMCLCLIMITAQRLPRSLGLGSKCEIIWEGEWLRGKYIQMQEEEGSGNMTGAALGSGMKD